MIQKISPIVYINSLIIIYNNLYKNNNKDIY